MRPGFSAPRWPPAWHNRGVEGKTQYILPAVAALVLIVLLVLRNQAGTETPAEQAQTAAAQPAGTAAEPPKGTKAAIRAAVEAAGSPSLGESTGTAVQDALRPVVDRCRASRPEAADRTIEVALDVLSATGLGARVDRAEVRGDLPADLVGCIREGMLGARIDDLGETGRLTTTLNYAAS